MKLKLLFFLILIPVYLCAQNVHDYTTYLDSSYSKASQNDHVYYRVVKDYYVIKETYAVELYYKSGNLKQAGILTDKDRHIYEGPLTSFYENGNVEKRVFYKEGKPFSTYKTWYENGNKKEEGLYIPSGNADQNDRILRISQYWDENNIQKVINGEGTHEDNFGKVSLKGKVKNGLRDSIWTGKDGGMKITFEEEYKNGLLISGTSTDENGVKRSYKEINQNPTPKKGIAHFYKFVAKKFYMKRNYTGKARILLSFVVNKNGTIEQVEVLKGVNSELDNEAVRVLNSYAEWQPGKYRGIDVNVLYCLPIALDLE